MPGKAVFLDRDGVLNDVVLRDGRPHPPESIAELKIIQSSVLACKMLTDAGLVLVGVTNQPDVARGQTTREQVEAINEVVCEEMNLREMRVCFHDDNDNCHCRKPKPGLLIEAARDFDIDLANSIMVGDRWKDVEAGVSAKCRTVFINRNYAEKRPGAVDHTAPDLLSAVPWILHAAGF